MQCSASTIGLLGRVPAEIGGREMAGSFKRKNSKVSPANLLLRGRNPRHGGLIALFAVPPNHHEYLLHPQRCYTPYNELYYILHKIHTT